jgi:hypothetical protein
MLMIEMTESAPMNSYELFTSCVSAADLSYVRPFIPATEAAADG